MGFGDFLKCRDCNASVEKYVKDEKNVNFICSICKKIVMSLSGTNEGTEIKVTDKSNIRFEV